MLSPEYAEQLRELGLEDTFHFGPGNKEPTLSQLLEEVKKRGYYYMGLSFGGVRADQTWWFNCSGAGVPEIKAGPESYEDSPVLTPEDAVALALIEILEAG